MTQTRDQQRFTILEVAADWHELWCRSALCGHPLPALMDNWTHGAASRHTIVPISHTRPSPSSRSYYSFPVPLRVEGWVGLSTQYRLATCSRLLAVDRVWVEPETCRLRVLYSTTRPLHPLNWSKFSLVHFPGESKCPVLPMLAGVHVSICFSVVRSYTATPPVW